MKLEYGETKQEGPTEVDEDGAFELGNTRFGDLRIEKNEDARSILVATGNVNGNTVLAFIKIGRPFAPWWKVSLKSEAFDSPEELWAQTLFGNGFDRLEVEEQATVRASIPAPKIVATDDDVLEDETSVEGEGNVGTSE